MTEYVTTNIRLPKAMHERVKRLALEENKSMAQVVRESLVQYVTSMGEENVLRAPDYEDPLMALGDLTRPDEVIDGNRPTDTAFRHDYYLYGTDQPEDVMATGEYD